MKQSKNLHSSAFLRFMIQKCSSTMVKLSCRVDQNSSLWCIVEVYNSKIFVVKLSHEMAILLTLLREVGGGGNGPRNYTLAQGLARPKTAAGQKQALLNNIIVDYYEYGKYNDVDDRKPNSDVQISKRGHLKCYNDVTLNRKQSKIGGYRVICRMNKPLVSF